ncbi:CPBP family intramembrane glutamic endopeptidase [Curtobacterium sp. Leaf261]|uniref:CPBP family intramembrane glutamic endopeptidase n=1 Tax=Curtobacterium sp. Leaf261 TaxID=1736311 RepID=UPI0006FF9712|nr:CPBP family intramembrane glutamic endopeptidase [Curtobacterium sp. Leaf261]KQO59989.1 hypothetical protein ASF23_15160 [Curtobacterium sp. Leaf261]
MTDGPEAPTHRSIALPDTETGREPSVGWGPGIAVLLGLIGCWFLPSIVGRGLLSSDIGGSAVGLSVAVSSYVPLLAAVAWVGRRDTVDRLGLRLRRVDVPWALAMTAVAAAVWALLGLWLLGDAGIGSDGWIQGGPSIGDVASLVVEPVIVAPIITELMFRGVLLRWLVARVRSTGWNAFAPAIGVVVTALVAAVVHVLGTSFTAPGSAPVTIMEFTGTFVFGLLVGAVAVRTDRIGAAVLAHVFFAALETALVWPW